MRLRLRHNGFGFVLGMFDHGGGIGFGPSDLGGILGTQRFGFGAQGLGLIKLCADFGDLLVEQACD